MPRTPCEPGGGGAGIPGVPGRRGEDVESWSVWDWGVVAIQGMGIKFSVQSSCHVGRLLYALRDGKRMQACALWVPDSRTRERGVLNCRN